MSRDDRISPEDRSLFREAATGTRPLTHDRCEPTLRRPRPAAHQRRLDEREVMRELALGDGFERTDSETGDELLYLRPGVQHQVMRKLRRGHYRVEAELDLHGLTAREAREAMSRFLAECLHRGLRCIRVIHGKGNRSLGQQPVLKRKVDGWLAQRNEVLAFASARPVDGGTGAVYVLLRSSGR